jgi:hypothetical protein
VPPRSPACGTCFPVPRLSTRTQKRIVSLPPAATHLPFGDSFTTSFSGASASIAGSTWRCWRRRVLTAHKPPSPASACAFPRPTNNRSDPGCQHGVPLKPPPDVTRSVCQPGAVRTKTSPFSPIHASLAPSPASPLTGPGVGIRRSCCPEAVTSQRSPAGSSAFLGRTQRMLRLTPGLAEAAGAAGGAAWPPTRLSEPISPITSPHTTRFVRFAISSSPVTIVAQDSRQSPMAPSLPRVAAGRSQSPPTVCPASARRTRSGRSKRRRNFASGHSLPPCRHWITSAPCYRPNPSHRCSIRAAGLSPSPMPTGT